MPQLIFFCGHAGTGKTTLAKRFVRTALAQQAGPWCLLDKDTLYGGYSAAVMGALTGNPNDRDSPTYLQHLRNPEYAGLLATARENLALGVNVVVVGPLTREVRAHHLTDRAWLSVDGAADAAGGAGGEEGGGASGGPGVEVRVVWVQLAEAEARRRIERRGNPNDAWKLAHWDDYRQRLFVPLPHEYPELIPFDNTAPSDATVDALMQSLLHG